MKFFSKNFWLNLFFPISCLQCQKTGKGYLCPDCFKQLSFHGEITKLNLQYIDKILAAGNYQDPPAAKLIKAFKFKSIIEIGSILTEFLRIYWQGRAIFLKDDFLVIPIPLSRRKKRRRGFNQVEVIAQLFALQFGYLMSNDLKRKHKRAQSKLGKESRKKNIANSFYWCGSSLKGKSIILLDDVITTGATVDEAAKILKKAGAEQIIALAVFKS
jgi:ComF family protein